MAALFGFQRIMWCVLVNISISKQHFCIIQDAVLYISWWQIWKCLLLFVKWHPHLHKSNMAAEYGSEIHRFDCLTDYISTTATYVDIFFTPVHFEKYPGITYLKYKKIHVVKVCLIWIIENGRQNCGFCI